MRRLAAPDRLLGLILLAIGAGIAASAVTIDDGFGAGAVSPRAFPLLLCGVLAAIGLLFLVRGGPHRMPAGSAGRAVLGFAALLLIYCLTFAWGDFRIWTAVFMGVSLPWLGETRPLRVAVIALATALGIHALFRYGFDTVLPVWF